MPIELPPYRPIKRRNGLKVMFASIHALIIRELRTRFGEFRLGYLWALIEPGFQVLLFVMLFGAIMQKTMLGIEYPVFLVGGMVPWFFFQKTVVRALNAVSANAGLLCYRPVRPIDTVIARIILEFIIFLLVFIVFLIGLYLSGYSLSSSHIDQLFSCWLFMGAFTFGFSLIMMVTGHRMPELGKFIAISFTIVYFCSGILYSIHIIPEPYQSYLLYNPIIHNLEMMRHSLSPTYPIHHISMSYFLICTAVVLFSGLLMYQYAEKDMMRQK